MLASRAANSAGFQPRSAQKSRNSSSTAMTDSRRPIGSPATSA